MDKHDFTEQIVAQEAALAKYLAEKKLFHTIAALEDLTHLWLLNGNKQKAREYRQRLEDVLSTAKPEDIAPQLPAAVSASAFLESKRRSAERLKERIENFSAEYIGFIQAEVVPDD